MLQERLRYVTSTEYIDDRREELLFPLNFVAILANTRNKNGKKRRWDYMYHHIG